MVHPKQKRRGRYTTTLLVFSKVGVWVLRHAVEKTEQGDTSESQPFPIRHADLPCGWPVQYGKKREAMQSTAS